MEDRRGAGAGREERTRKGRAYGARPERGSCQLIAKGFATRTPRQLGANKQHTIGS
jgi:hypothetical protein